MTATRQPLVLAAGLLCDATVWEPVAARLADVANCTIVAFGGCRSMGAMADRVLDAAPSRFALAGHSMGGRVALEAYARAPERITRMALLNTGVQPVGASEAAGRNRLVALARAEGMDALVREWLPPMVGARAWADPARMDEMSAMIRRMLPEDFAGQVAAMLDRPDAEAPLASLAVPTLLMSSTGDGWSPPAQHEAMRDRVAGATLEIVADVGHMSPLEAPDAVAAALRRWLAAG